MARVASLYDGNVLAPQGKQFTAWLYDKICNAEEFRDACAEDGLEVPSDELMDAEAEVAYLYAVKDALINLPERIMLVGVLESLKTSNQDDQYDKHDAEDEEALESIKALIRADIDLIDECLR